MEVEWINGKHKEDNLIFDSDFEAYEWADSITQDLSGYLWDRKNGGYMTRDIKVFEYLAKLVPSIAEIYNVENVCFNKEKEIINGQTNYKFWITHK